MDIVFVCFMLSGLVLGEVKSGCLIDSCSPMFAVVTDYVQQEHRHVFGMIYNSLLCCLWYFKRYLFDSVNNVGSFNKVMDITIYILPDMLSLISQFFPVG